MVHNLCALNSQKLPQGIRPDPRYQTWPRVNGAIGSILGGKCEGPLGVGKAEIPDLVPKIKKSDHYIPKYNIVVAKSV